MCDKDPGEIWALVLLGFFNRKSKKSLVIPAIGNEIYWVITANSMDDFQLRTTFDKANYITNLI